MLLRIVGRMSDRMKADTRINEPEIIEWLKTKKNKSNTTRKALKLLYQKELQEKYAKQKPQIVITDA